MGLGISLLLLNLLKLKCECNTSHENVILEIVIGIIRWIFAIKVGQIKIQKENSRRVSSRVSPVSSPTSSSAGVPA